MGLETALGSGGIRSNRFYPSEATHDKIVQGGSYTVPDNRQGTSPSSGQPFSTPVAFAEIYCVDHNDTGFVPMESYRVVRAKPGSVISLTVAANRVALLIDGVEVWAQQGTALTSASAMFFVQ